MENGAGLCWFLKFLADGSLAIYFQQHFICDCSDIYLTPPGWDTNPSQVSSQQTIVLNFQPQGQDEI